MFDFSNIKDKADVKIKKDNERIDLINEIKSIKRNLLKNETLLSMRDDNSLHTKYVKEYVNCETYGKIDINKNLKISDNIRDLLNWFDKDDSKLSINDLKTLANKNNYEFKLKWEIKEFSVPDIYIPRYPDDGSSSKSYTYQPRTNDFNKIWNKLQSNGANSKERFLYFKYNEVYLSNFRDDNNCPCCNVESKDFKVINEEYNITEGGKFGCEDVYCPIGRKNLYIQSFLEKDNYGNDKKNFNKNIHLGHISEFNNFKKDFVEKSFEFFKQDVPEYLKKQIIGVNTDKMYDERKEKEKNEKLYLERQKTFAEEKKKIDYDNAKPYKDELSKLDKLIIQLLPYEEKIKNNTFTMEDQNNLNLLIDKIDKEQNKIEDEMNKNSNDLKSKIDSFNR